MSNLEKVNKQITECKKCILHAERTKSVPGEGSETADVMFIGEGPGANEDKQGRPFCGAAGNVLEELLNSINLKRETVYITNVVKCRPPGNRDPLPEEVKTCWPYLERQFKIIEPKLFVLLGRHAMERFVTGKRISEAHGVLLRKEIRNDEDKISYRHFSPIYHPAAALYNGSLKEVIMQDFQKIPRIIEKIEEFENIQKKENLNQEQML